jgi:hypothetical protein
VVVDDNKPARYYVDRLKKAMDEIEAGKTPYNPFTTNSNATAREAIERSGLTPPKPPVWAPGWGTPLPR